MNKAKIRFDRDYTVGRIDPRIRGSFVEHLGRCLYNGVYEPLHPSADELGFRGDVKELIRELGVTAIRYPGGNFVSGYDWKDGIGPQEARPVRRELAWNVLETNQVGTDEFAAYCADLGVELIMAANLGTGTPHDAGELVDYCNTPGGTALSDLRIRNGAEKPHNIKLWCLGNEMDGAWQIGALDAQTYAAKAKEAAKIIKWMDPQVATIACGTCTNELGHHSFGDWDRIVLEHAYDEIDYLSLHRYFNYHPDKQLFYKMDDDITDIPYFFRDLHDFIHTVTSACDFVKGKLRKEKDIHISFDEWGVITQTAATPGGQEQNYHHASFSQLDAVISGGILCTFINHADRVKIACQSLLVNEGGMISTCPGGKAIRQATFYPFRDVSRYAAGTALRGMTDMPVAKTNHHGTQETLVTCAAHDADSGVLCVMIANVDLENDCEVQLSLTGFGGLQPVSMTTLYTDDPNAVNTFSDEGRVRPRSVDLAAPRDGELTIRVKKHSWNTLVFNTKP